MFSQNWLKLFLAIREHFGHLLRMCWVKFANERLYLMLLNQYKFWFHVQVWLKNLIFFKDLFVWTLYWWFYRFVHFILSSLCFVLICNIMDWCNLLRFGFLWRFFNFRALILDDICLIILLAFCYWLLLWIIFLMNRFLLYFFRSWGLWIFVIHNNFLCYLRWGDIFLRIIVLSLRRNLLKLFSCLVKKLNFVAI